MNLNVRRYSKFLWWASRVSVLPVARLYNGLSQNGDSYMCRYRVISLVKSLCQNVLSVPRKFHPLFDVSGNESRQAHYCVAASLVENSRGARAVGADNTLYAPWLSGFFPTKHKTCPTALNTVSLPLSSRTMMASCSDSLGRCGFLISG